MIYKTQSEIQLLLCRNSFAFLVSELQNLLPLITLNLRNYCYIHVCGNLVLEITISIVSKFLPQHKSFRTQVPLTLAKVRGNFQNFALFLC